MKGNEPYKPALWVVMLLMVAVLVHSQQRSENLDVDDLIGTIVQLERENFQEPADDYSNVAYFDFIVVGAGAAGCTVSSRLSEVALWDVLLLEAGSEETFAMDIPFLFADGVIGSNWNYTSAPQKSGGCPSGPNATCPYPYAKTMGGGTSVNFMVFVRGNKMDYDNWSEMGNTGWSYDEVLPYFKKMENVQIPSLSNSFYHGTQGNIMNSRSEGNILTNMTFESARELNIPQVDYNGPNQSGISFLQTTTYRGIRWSANRGYLYPARKRQNLFVRKRCLVSKILMEDKRAVGVEYIRDGEVHWAYAKREVIISAGAINSPKLLMLSGIGPREHLEQFNIPVIQDLPVGRGLMDHPLFVGLNMVINQTLWPTRSEILSNLHEYANYFVNRRGPLSTLRMMESIRYSEKGDAANTSWSNIETIFKSESLVTDELIATGLGFSRETYETFFRPMLDFNSINIMMLHLRPKSRGYVNLTSNDINSPPLINPNYFSVESDVEDMVQGVKDAIELLTTGPFQAVGSQVYNKSLPLCEEYEFLSDEYWACTVRWASSTCYHPCGTCKMGPENDAFSVVTPDLKVKGIENLRVIDASVIPVIPAAHMQVPTYMVAEKGADMVKMSHIETDTYD